MCEEDGLGLERVSVREREGEKAKLVLGFWFGFGLVVRYTRFTSNILYLKVQ